jgi:outer membrane receptor for ferrienterochelin and colicin
VAKRLALIFALLLATLGFSVPQASAQAGLTFARLSGTVTDPNGGTVPGAVVKLREVDTNLTYNATGNDNGFYALPNLPPGQYELTVTHGGFATFIQKGVTLTVGQTANLDVALKVASATDTVTVTTEAVAVESTRTEVSQVIETPEIQSLPTATRQFIDFALLTPGVAIGRTSLQSTFTEPEVTRISFGGMRDLSNFVTVDGADYINSATGSQRTTPPQESVSEFRVVNNSFGAEYGRALGGIVNVVTKSGSNDLHGSLYGYLQNNDADARTLLTQPQYNEYHRGQFGASIGGPVKKDKTFFFANYEGQRLGESPTYPSTLLDNITTIDAAKAALHLAPENLNALKTLNNDNGFVRLDHQFNEKNRLSIHYGIQDQRDLNVLVGDTLDGGGIGAPSSGHDAFVRDQSLVGSLNTLFKPDLVNTLLVQWARRHYNFPGVTGEPNLDIPNTLLFGHNFGTFDATDESREQFSDTVVWVKGKHEIKFGGDVNFIQNFVIWPGFNPMRIVLPGINCLVDFARYVSPLADIPEVPADGPCPTDTIAPPNFGFPASNVGPNPFDALNGVPIVFWGAPVGTGPIVQGSLPPVIPTTWQNAYVDPQDYNVNIHHSYYGLYLQDQWKLNHKLTLNYGLRWDFEGGLWRVIHHDYRGYQPRVGLAYSPSKNTVIRAGFGIFDDRENMTFVFVTYPQREVLIPNAVDPGTRVGNSSATYVLNQLPAAPCFEGLLYPNGAPAPCPWAAAKQLILTGQNEPNFSTGPAGSVVTNSGGGIDPNSRISYSEQASLQIDHQFGDGFVVSVSYLMVAAHKLTRPVNLNVCPSAGLSNAATDCPPASALGYVNNQLPDGKAAFSGALYTNAGLMYYIDNSGNAIYHGGSVGLQKKFTDLVRFSANYTYSKTLDDGTFATFVSTPQDLYDRSLERAQSNQDVRHRFVANFTADAPHDSFLRNFELSSIITLQTPRPFTIFVGNDINNDTNPVTDRVGLSARNTYEGDDFQTIDTRLSRKIYFAEKRNLEVAFDAFNLFNRANVNEVTSVYGGGTDDFCGAVPRHYKDAASVAIQKGAVACDGATNGGAPAPNPLFGTPRTMFNARELQISAKFTF